MSSPEPPPYTITSAILSLVAEIAGEVGRMGALSGAGQVPKLRRENRIRSVHASLAIENNTLSFDQVTAVLSGKRVHGPAREIREVENAFAAYEAMPSWNPSSSKDLLAAHRLMLAGLVPDAGKFPTRSVGIAQGQRIVHLAPPADRVPGLMKDPLGWLKRTDAHPLIAGCGPLRTGVHPPLRRWKRPDGPSLADAHSQPVESALCVPAGGIRHP